MSDLQFRSRAHGRDLSHGQSSLGGWLIFAGAALSVTVLGLVIASAPAPDANSGANAASSASQVEAD